MSKAVCSCTSESILKAHQIQAYQRPQSASFFFCEWKIVFFFPAVGVSGLFCSFRLSTHWSRTDKAVKAQERLKTPSWSGPQHTGLEVAANLRCDGSSRNQRSWRPCAAVCCSLHPASLLVRGGRPRNRSANVMARAHGKSATVPASGAWNLRGNVRFPRQYYSRHASAPTAVIAIRHHRCRGGHLVHEPATEKAGSCVC